VSGGAFALLNVASWFLCRHPIHYRTTILFHFTFRSNPHP
jgi:hypothetical protein